MITELGQFALALLFMTSLAALLPLLSPRLAVQAGWQAFSRRAAYVMCALTVGCFSVLMHGFVTSDFSLLVVLNNSHTLKPMLYKIAGTWGQHEGSLLLWILVLTGCAAALAWRSGLTELQRTRTLGVLATLTAGFSGLSLFTSNPFARVIDPPLQGHDLNPLLQDPGLAFHPPLLYVGYVGFSVAFAIAVAALLEGRFDRKLASAMLPWVRFAWTTLTAGLTLGAWWAYYELGWGGWWFWDPVENAALLPWLTGTALLHSAQVARARQTMTRWTLLLSLITFSLAMMGTFLVRSGVLTSVHAFASDPARGLVILALLLLFAGGAFTLYAMRLPKLPVEQPFPPLSREGALLLNNILLAVGAATVLVGTLYPLLISAFGLPPLSVGAPYFNAVFVPLMLPLMAALPMGAFLPWRAGSMKRLLPLIVSLFAASVIGTIGYLYFIGFHGALALLGFVGGIWIVAGTALDMRRNWSGRFWPRWLAHLGLGIAVVGMAGTPLDIETVQKLTLPARFSYAGYHFQADRIAAGQGPNYTTTGLPLDAWNDDENVRLTPQKRFYPTTDTTTTEAAIHPRLTGDLFITLGDILPDNAVTLRLRYHPLMIWLWLGAALMVAAGMAGLARRKS